MSAQEKILIADDDMLLVSLLEHKLRQKGYDVVSVYDGQSTLDQVATFIPDLLILDGMMPHLDGFQVLRELKADDRWATIPVFMLTARRMENDVVEGLSLGAADYLVKPFSPDELVARIARALNSGDAKGNGRAAAV
ncbi:response regulator [Breoghania sp. L-A4]|uniref:response regulator transcription factor n=1 Tax=Breoghania sp. L-A4 TaxID=2304600 RepID=UPI000E35EFD0|nr:response regulator [Breoghania sp. L-A4]AXS39854.1 DNA-binding response regulator [Breoghania sp. L-A4]